MGGQSKYGVARWASARCMLAVMTAVQQGRSCPSFLTVQDMIWTLSRVRGTIIAGLLHLAVRRNSARISSGIWAVAGRAEQAQC